MFTRDDLDALVRTQAEPAVSIYLPTHSAGRETRQDPIRFRNLLGEAEQRLRDRGARDPQIEAVLGPARALLGENEFWRHQDSGLAVFMAPDHFQHDRVPIAFAEEVVVGRRFHVKPLLPLLGGEGFYYVLTITAESALLLQGSREGLAEVEVPGMPDGAGAIARETDFEETEHASAAGRPRSGAPAEGIGAATHGFGDTPEDLRKAQLIEYLRRVDRAVQQRLAGNQTAIVLVAQPHIEGNFRSVTQLPALHSQALHSDPATLGRRELHDRTWDLVRLTFEAGQREARAQLDMLLGNGDVRGALKPEEIVRAARWGRVDTLFLSRDANLWGSFDEAADRVEVHDTPAERDEDLADYAAVQTLLQGGIVHYLPDRLPRGGAIAAVLRY